MPRSISDLIRTFEDRFRVGKAGGGAKSFELFNGFLGRLLWSPTANRDIVVPDASGTIVLQNSGRIDGLQPAIAPGQPPVYEQLSSFLPTAIMQQLLNSIAALFPLLTPPQVQLIADSVQYASVFGSLTTTQIVALLAKPTNQFFDLQNYYQQYQNQAGTIPVTAAGQPLSVVKNWKSTNSLIADPSKAVPTADSASGTVFSDSASVMRLSTIVTNATFVLAAFQYRLPNPGDTGPWIIGSSTTSFHPQAYGSGLFAGIAGENASVSNGQIWKNGVLTTSANAVFDTYPTVLSVKPLAGVEVASIAEDRVYSVSPNFRTFYGNYRFLMVSSETYTTVEIDALNKFVTYYSRIASASIDLNTLGSASLIHYAGANGQSNVIGGDAYDFIDSFQPYNNLKLIDSTGLYSTVGDNLNWVPATAPIRSLNGGVDYPDNIGGQESQTAFANTMSKLYGAGVQWAIANYGRGGTGIDIWGKGGTGNSWVKGDFELQAAVMLAARHKLTLQYECEALIAGENDHANASYLQKLIQFGKDVQGRKSFLPNGQTEDIPVLSYQQHCFATDGSTVSLGTMAELYAHLQSPYHYCIGPRYQYRYVPVGQNNASGVHNDAWAQIQMGEKRAQALHVIKSQGGEWGPMRPIKITHTLATGILKIDLYVPYGPLRFDDNFQIPATLNGSANPWLLGRGFQLAGQGLTNSSGNNSVSISGNSIIIQLPPNATVADNLVNYAIYTTQAGVYAPGRGAAGFPRGGQVCDSDPFRGEYAQRIFCNVTNGSTNVTSVTSNGFRRVGWYWRVEAEQLAAGGQLPAYTIVSTRNSDSQITLSGAWTGVTGVVELMLRPDHSNYLLAFSLPIGYEEVQNAKYYRKQSKIAAAQSSVWEQSQKPTSVTGSAVVDFGAGNTNVATVITGQAGILSNSILSVNVVAIATTDHTIDEHVVEALEVRAGNIVPGVGFTVYAASRTGGLAGKYNVHWRWS
jgi:Carbohydrate esterase, sialic acid-specific acetylesterase